MRTAKLGDGGDLSARLATLKSPIEQGDQIVAPVVATGDPMVQHHGDLPADTLEGVKQSLRLGIRRHSDGEVGVQLLRGAQL